MSHLAAIVPSKGALLEVTNRPTPTPGPNELLIEVKSVGLNPVDYYQREFGFFISDYPTIVGSDVGGVVLAAGSAVSPDAAKPGTRVAAFATAFYNQGNPDYGALQQRVLVPEVNVTPIPESMSFNEASVLPMSVQTAWSGWHCIGVDRNTLYKPEDKKGVLIWGGASSVGSGALQSAKLMGFTVYTTASNKHHEYLKSLGADRTFDYKEEGVEAKIITAAKEDGVSMDIAYHAVGQLQSVLDVLTALKGDKAGRVASAPRVMDGSPTADGITVAFAAVPAEERQEFANFVFRIWLKEKLEKGLYVPSPHVRVIDGGLGAAQQALDILKKGVSGEKLVLEL